MIFLSAGSRYASSKGENQPLNLTATRPAIIQAAMENRTFNRPYNSPMIAGRNNTTRIPISTPSTIRPCNAQMVTKQQA